MKKSILVILIITGIINITTAQNYILEGTIKDENTGERLTGVNVYVPELEKGTVSDMNGKYELTLDEGEHRVVYSFVGYQRQEKKIDLTSDMVLDIWMDSGGLRLNEVLVTGERTNRNVEDTEMSAVTLDIETIKRIPAFLGEVDVLRTIQLMPGVQSAGDGNTGFFVRGGNADQNLVLLDDAVVFNASHLFNFFSVFNPDAINDVKLYKGGIFPEYGGRLSSVLDINMKTGDKDRYKVNGGLGLISSRLTAEGPIQRGKSSFLVSGRRTYADLFLKLSSDETQRETQLYFYDLNWKTNYVINDKNRVFFSGYFGRDVTMLSDLFGFDWGNTTMTLRWNHLFRENFFSDISFLYSNYQFNITGEVGPADFQWKSFLHNLNVKADFNWLPTEESTLNFGIQSIYHNLDPGTVSATVEGAADTNIDLTLNNGLEHGIYANYEQNLFDNRLSLAVGIRNSIYQVI
ncbi:MAG: TonB-dependent receptor, partial [Bacteroidota bacterium]